MFEDRYDAAHQLATALSTYKDANDVVLVAIPRGALEIGSVLAHELRAPLDIILVKKIGAPNNPELAIGAVSLTQKVIDPAYQADQAYLNNQISKLREKLKERSVSYRGDKQPLSLQDKIVILIDDGIATGQTMSLAVDLIKKQHPKKIIVAVPVGPPDIIGKLKQKVDKVICLIEPTYLQAIGRFYREFNQVDDSQAIKLLKEANQ